MKALCFQARRFRWKTHSKTLPEIADIDVEAEVTNALVIFLHAEQSDAEEKRRHPVFRGTLKHIKWLANKRELKDIVIHSFTHLGGQTADPLWAKTFIEDVAERLRDTGYRVAITPFGYFCEWDLSVYGDSLAKVWKEIH
jgi:hypothetical protein